MQSFSISKSPSSYFQSLTFFRILKLFKFELIKVVVFLLLFGALVFIVNSQSREYYGFEKKETLR
jgi:hypothetical protein